MGVGYLQLTPSLLYSMTYEELVVMATGKREQRQQAMQVSWEQLRWVNYYALLPHRKRGSKLKMQDIAVFPWEQDMKDSNEHRIKTIEDFKKAREAAYNAAKVTPPAMAQQDQS